MGENGNGTFFMACAHADEGAHRRTIKKATSPTFRTISPSAE
jgi:hypothetical protein